MTEAAIELPHCEACQRPHWPPREICPHCLGEPIHWRQADGAGQVLSMTIVHHSLSDELRPHLPLHVAAVKLDCGVRVIAYLADGPQPSGARVIVTTGSSPSGQEALVATPPVPG